MRSRPAVDPPGPSSQGPPSMGGRQLLQDQGGSVTCRSQPSSTPISPRQIPRIEDRLPVRTPFLGSGFFRVPFPERFLWFLGFLTTFPLEIFFGLRENLWGRAGTRWPFEVRVTPYSPSPAGRRPPGPSEPLPSSDKDFSLSQSLACLPQRERTKRKSELAFDYGKKGYPKACSKVLAICGYPRDR
jgi:hypothetical protein